MTQEDIVAGEEIAELEMATGSSDPAAAEASSGAESFSRRHDLDALRAFAMFLGIGLHAALAYQVVNIAWPVHDRNTAAWVSIGNSVIHGFRMPLFFLISGFFTAMLWRKRGLPALIKHRALRIAAPLGLGMVTIIPVVWAVSIGAGITQRIQDERSEKEEGEEKPIRYAKNRELIGAIKVGNMEKFRAALEESPDLDAIDEWIGWTPLCFAAAHNHSEMCEELIRAGASVDWRSRDRGTALHMACFWGSAESAEVLLANGADIEIKNSTEATPRYMLYVDQDTTMSISELVGVMKPWAKVTKGRERAEELFPPDPLASAIGKDRGPLIGLLLVLCMLPVFHHLWFLWFLVWLIVCFAGYAWLVEKVGWKGPPRFLLTSPGCFLWLLPPTLLPQSLMGLIYPGFGPDTSIGFVPLPHLFFYYAIFFGFGVWYFDADDQSGKLYRLWWLQLPLALLVVFPLAYEFTLGEFGFGEKLLDESNHRFASNVLQVLYVWMMCFGLMGLFRCICKTERPWVRYLSDSS
ncbi:MAG: acyltransferase family protein, partial [Planctomycetota bacterium]